MTDKPGPRRPVEFPPPRPRVEREPETFEDLGESAMAMALGVGWAAQYGHWCSRCEGIWWGLPLEAQCPQCGHRGP